MRYVNMLVAHSKYTEAEAVLSSLRKCLPNQDEGRSADVLKIEGSVKEKFGKFEEALQHRLQELQIRKQLSADKPNDDVAECLKGIGSL